MCFASLTTVAEEVPLDRLFVVPRIGAAGLAQNIKAAHILVLRTVIRMAVLASGPGTLAYMWDIFLVSVSAPVVVAGR